ncbi:hypothetical protein WN51_05190 [Melipona quadrifasciata]|uniref:Uncharacterized protein n=1 Tax=Melipona quadrifasciata TaxID=166423 RepID=A0A0M8ZRH8_9HYME|nr:hypothetical protein WN51_05190 [Melipona quadrifasciata]
MYTLWMKVLHIQRLTNYSENPLSNRKRAKTSRSRPSCKPWQAMANHSFRKSNKRTVEIKTW